jgi:hypothetical protein
MRYTALGVLLLLAACDRSSADDSISPNALTDGMVAIVDDVNAKDWPRDPITIDSATISGNALTIVVRYGGGCRDHILALLLSRAFMESHPVQIGARLSHNAKSDACDALITKTLTFDLTRLKQRYQASYGRAPATILINLSGLGRQLRYAFE